MMNKTAANEINEERREQLDKASRRNMEHCAAFIAGMIEKYGKEVIAEIEAQGHEPKKNAAGTAGAKRRLSAEAAETACRAQAGTVQIPG